MLTQCLATHPQVSFALGEPLRGPNPLGILIGALSVPGYDVSGCRVLYSQLHQGPIRNYLCAVQPLVIWLRRRSLLAQAFSVIMYGRGQEHTTSPLPAPPVAVEPQILRAAMQNLAERNELGAREVEKFRNVLPLWYEDICTDAQGWLPASVTSQICAFLGVREEPMRTELQRIHRDLPEAITNWAEVKAAVQQSDLAGEPTWQAWT